MLSIGKLTTPRVDYYLGSLTATTDEYYLNPTEIPGRWTGALAPTLGLGLDGQVNPDGFRSIIDGRHPGDDRPLIPGAGTAGRVSGFDLTFSAPKSVSVAWALSDPDTASVVAAAHDAAVGEAFAALEAEAVMARRGHGGTRQIPGLGLVGAAFTHRTSRCGDPQLHTHLVVANLTTDTHGRWSTPDGRVIYGWAKTVGYLYQTALRARLTETLGVTWGPVTKGSAEITGTTRAQRDRFSGRRTQVVAELDRLGYHSPRAARTATLATRPAKDRDVDLDGLRTLWAAQARQVDLEVAGVFGRRRTPAQLDLTAELLGPGGLTANTTSFDRRNVLQGLAAGHRDGAHPDVLRATATALFARDDVIALATTTPAGGRRHTTTELVAVEARLVEHALARQADSLGTVTQRLVDQVLAERASLSPEQADMVTRLVTSGGGVDVVVGRAGTGKTFALDAARAAWETGGYRVIGTALAARAAAGLQAGAGIPSTTVDRLLAELDRPGPLAGLPPWTVIVVDEAGMIGTRKLDRLLTHAKRAHAKVVVVGDPRQLPEIDAGGALAALARRLTPIELSVNRRQTEAWERHALDELRTGTVTAAVAAYRTAGRITIAPSADTTRRALVDDWWAAHQTRAEHAAVGHAGVGQSGPGGERRSSQTAMYALTRADVDDLNTRARAHLRHAGQLSGPDVTVAGRDFAVGDQVLALRNDRRLRITNGTTGTLTAITPTGAVLDTTGGPVTVPGDYLTAGHLTHAYATTIHKAQGATVDQAFVLGSDHLYRQAGYVGLSRARNTTRLYIVGPQPPTPPPHHLEDPSGTRNHDGLRQLAVALATSKAQTLALDQLAAPGVDNPADHRDHQGGRDQALPSRLSVLADPPEWAVDALGPPPLWGVDRERWADTATRVAAYRHAYNPDQSSPGREPTGRSPEPCEQPVKHGDRDRCIETAIGPEPAEPGQHRAWKLARISLTQTLARGRDRDLDQGLHL